MTSRTEYLAEELEDIEARITAYKAAELAILGGAQSYKIGNREITRSDLVGVEKILKRLYGRRIKLARNGGIRVQRPVLRDDI